jgi:hypothetical protein
MGLRDWWNERQKRKDQDELERAEHMQYESAAERQMAQGNVEGMEADRQASDYGTAIRRS